MQLVFLSLPVAHSSGQFLPMTSVQRVPEPLDKCREGTLDGYGSPVVRMRGTKGYTGTALNDMGRRVLFYCNLDESLPCCAGCASRI